MRAERVGADTLLTQIVRMVGEAQRTRAPIQRMADRVSAWFVPAVVAVAVLAAVIWGSLGPEPRFAHVQASCALHLEAGCRGRPERDACYEAAADAAMHADLPAC